MSKRPLFKRDLTELATPFYFVAMGAEAFVLHRRRQTLGPSPGDYERNDTLASLTMGTASLVLPLVAPKVFRHLNPKGSKLGKAVVALAAGAAVVSVVAGRRASRESGGNFEGQAQNLQLPDDRSGVIGAASSQNLSGVAAAGALCLGGVALTSWWFSAFTASNLFRRRVLPDLGGGAIGFLAAMVGWDLIYYWNHRFMHTFRYMWAMHVVHHSSEHYNLSTALRQPIAEPFTTPLPYGALCLFGVRPELIATARGINLLWQFWIHTETVQSMGQSEVVLNSPSAHRVHHGSNRQYLDRNHGGILIIWDRLFGTFEPEDERVIYGLTKNMNSFSPLVIAGHEYVAMVSDMARASTWRRRFAALLGPPGSADKPIGLEHVGHVEVNGVHREIITMS